jgi:hypothetical protein
LNVFYEMSLEGQESLLKLQFYELTELKILQRLMLTQITKSTVSS